MELETRFKLLSHVGHEMWEVKKCNRGGQHESVHGIGLKEVIMKFGIEQNRVHGCTSCNCEISYSTH